MFCLSRPKDDTICAGKRREKATYIVSSQQSSGTTPATRIKTSAATAISSKRTTRAPAWTPARPLPGTTRTGTGWSPASAATARRGCASPASSRASLRSAAQMARQTRSRECATNPQRPTPLPVIRHNMCLLLLCLLLYFLFFFWFANDCRGGMRETGSETRTSTT